jgi:hypothetical membrane protein
MTPRQTLASGLLSAGIFAGALLVIASLEPSYSHATRAVSELGAVGAPHQWTWNILGFLLPGLLVVLFGIGTGHALAPRGRSASILLMISGLAFAATGVFPADLHAMSSFATRAHIVASLISLAAWFPAAIVIAVVAHTLDRKPLMWASIAGLAALLASIVLGAAFLSRGYAQRLNFAAYFAWIVWIACLLPKNSYTPSPSVRYQTDA